MTELEDGKEVVIGDVQIRPFRLAQAYVYAFIFEGDGRRVLIVPDETFGSQPAEEVMDVDLAILPMGIMEFDLFTGERRIDPDHPVLREEATFLQTLDMVDTLHAKRVVLTHIEERDGLSYDDLTRLQQHLYGLGRHGEFAFDGMQIHVG